MELPHHAPTYICKYTVYKWALNPTGEVCDVIGWGSAQVRDEGGREVRGVCPSHAVTLSESCVENQHVSELHLPHI